MSVLDGYDLHIGTWVRFGGRIFRQVEEISQLAGSSLFSVEFRDGRYLLSDDPLWELAEILYPNLPHYLRLASLDKEGIYNVYLAKYDAHDLLRVLKDDVAALEAAGVKEEGK
jgi:hypothetical protein